MSKMPVIFVGHGSPTNAIEDNAYTREWRRLGAAFPKPRGILCVSAHWFVRGTKINTTAAPQQIYDMYGFPPELYALKYPAQGSPALAARVLELLHGPAEADNSWGIDHGAWSVLVHLFPTADIPVVQLSLDRGAPASAHYKLAAALKPLREEGILLLASGNVVHNLGRVAWGMNGGLDWAERFDLQIRDSILQKDIAAVADYPALGSDAALAVPTPEHFLPLLYALGASDPADQVSVFNRSCVLGSLSMTGYVFGTL